ESVLDELSAGSGATTEDARWIAEYTYFVYKQAFIHGHKHGKEDEVKDALEP
ncbi:hypothetical protein LCGC14_2682850, partial [marine sediment metagenome]